MINKVSIEDILKMKNTLIIDVRSPGEYEDGSVYEAINMPILGDDERALVGTVYRQECKDKAIKMGIEYASKKLSDIYDLLKIYAKEYDNIVFVCFRGGMRSKSVCSFANMMGIKNVFQLDGGYKAYRNFVVDFLNHDILEYDFIMLHGLTGVGKTHILEKLAKRKSSILNLEELASNSGSVFGNIMYNKKLPTQKNFDSAIFHALYGLEDKRVYVESESKRIGNVIIVNSIFDKIMSDMHILIKTNIDNRVKNIKLDYINGIKENDEKLKEAIEHLRKRLGNKKIEELLFQIDNKEYEKVIKYLVFDYYDPLYKYSIDKFDNYHLEVYYEDMNEAVDEIIKFVDNSTKKGRINYDA